MKINTKSVAVHMLKAGIANQRDLAAKAGLSANTVSLLMRGASGKLETMGKIAAALDADPADIIEED